MSATGFIVLATLTPDEYAIREAEYRELLKSTGGCISGIGTDTITVLALDTRKG